MLKCGSALLLSLLLGVSYADLKEFSPNSHGKWPKPAWIEGKWVDKSQDAIYMRERADIEKLPSRDKSTSTTQIQALITRTVLAMEKNPNWKNLYRLAYVIARYPRSTLPYHSDLVRYAFRYSSPDSREYARAMFCGLAMSDNAWQVPKPVVERLRHSSDGDPTLGEALVKHQNRASRQKREDAAWALDTARALYNKYPRGRYVYGALVLHNIWINAVTIGGIEAAENAIKQMEALIADGYLEPVTVREARDGIARLKKANEIARRKKGGSVAGVWLSDTATLGSQRLHCDTVAHAPQYPFLPAA